MPLAGRAFAGGASVGRACGAAPFTRHLFASSLPGRRTPPVAEAAADATAGPAPAWFGRRCSGDVGDAMSLSRYGKQCFCGTKKASPPARRPGEFLCPRNDCWPHRPSDTGRAPLGGRLGFPLFGCPSSPIGAMSPAGARHACATCARSQCLLSALTAARPSALTAARGAPASRRPRPTGLRPRPGLSRPRHRTRGRRRRPGRLRGDRPATGSPGASRAAPAAGAARAGLATGPAKALEPRHRLCGNFANGKPIFAERAFEALSGRLETACSGLRGGSSGRCLPRCRSRAPSGIARGRGSSGSRGGKSGQ
jgi:hypothetical protein